MKIDITENQKNFIIMSVDRHVEDVYDDPEAYGYDEDDYNSEDEMLKAIEKDIKEIEELAKICLKTNTY